MTQIVLHLPLCTRTEKKESTLSLGVRITFIVCGTLSLTIGALIFFNIPTLNHFGTTGVVSLASLGTLLILVGTFFKGIKNRPESQRIPIETKQQVFMKKYIKEHRYEEVELPHNMLQAFEQNKDQPTGGLSTLKNTFTLDENLATIFENQNVQYLLIGERHNENASKQFILDYADQFVHAGFEIIGTEFYVRRLQANFDAYHWEIEKEMPAFPSSVVFGQSRLPILETLSQKGLRPVALESKNSAKQSGSSSMREVVFDPAASANIYEELCTRGENQIPLSRSQKGKKRAIVWVGAAHLYNIATYLGPEKCACLLIHDKSADKPAYIIGDTEYKNTLSRKPKSTRPIDLHIYY